MLIIMKKLKEFKVFDYHFIYLFLMVIFGGIIGFIIECFATGISKGYIDSRFQRLPCILGYGLMILALYLLFGTPNKMRILKNEIFTNKKNLPIKHFLYFLIVTTFIFFCEWGAGELFELLIGVGLWDYSNIPLHIGQYVCLPFALGFGAGAYVFMAFIFSPIMSLLENKMPMNIALIIFFVIGTPVVIDFITTTVIICSGRVPRIIWRINFPWMKEKETTLLKTIALSHI